MGRNSSTKLPFLIEKNDSQQFIYNRVLPPDLAPYVAGDVTVEWTSKTIHLKGSKAIKVSLKTGDLATAKDRWVALHAQVQAMVQRAEGRVRARKVNDLARMVSALGPPAIRQMTGQVQQTSSPPTTGAGAIPPSPRRSPRSCSAS